MATASIQVEGLTTLNRALRRADRDVRLGIRKELRAVAEPVRVDAEQLAGSEISHLASGAPWAGMRTGQTQTMVYVAPKQRGVKRRGDFRRRRPKFGDLLQERAMDPAAARNIGNLERGFERFIDRVADNFNGGAI